MSVSGLPELAHVAQLLDFLPGFSEPGRKFVAEAERQMESERHTHRVQHPTYDDDVVAFFMLIGTTPWLDPEYHSSDPERLVACPGQIARATFREVRAVLNLCSRGERYCDGYWLKVLQEGVVQAALKRLEELSIPCRDGRKVP